MTDSKTARQDILTRKLVIPENYIIIVGCGGSGYNTALILAMAGCKNFILIDHDVLDVSNRNRLLTLESDISRSKVEILKDLLQSQGASSVITYNEQACYKLLEGIQKVHDIDVIINCVDTFYSIKMIAEFCTDFGIRMVRAGSDDDKISFATSLGGLLDFDGEDGYQTFPNWVGGTMLSAVFAGYLILYPEIEVPVTTIPVFTQIFGLKEEKETK